MEENYQEKSKYHRLLSKYTVVWIWSIMITLNAGITYTFYNINNQNFGHFGLAIIMTNLMAFLVALMGWVRLYQILKILILPNLFEDESKVETAKKNIIFRERSFVISSAFNYIIVAISLRFAAFILEIFFISFFRL